MIKFEDLPWEDVIFPKIFSRLTIDECFNFSEASSDFYPIVREYIRSLKQFNLPYRHKSFIRIKAVSQLTECLTELNISNSKDITNEIALNFFNNNLNLQIVNCSNCKNLSAVCLHPLMIKCKNVQELNLSGSVWLTVECTETLIFHMTNLRKLIVTDCPQISDFECRRFNAIMPDLRIITGCSFPPNFTSWLLLQL